LVGLLTKRTDVITGCVLFFTFLLSACGGGGRETGTVGSPSLPANLQKTAALAYQPLPVPTPRSADSFVDAIGVNTHLHDTGTGYVSAWSQVQSLLLSLGVRHIRDAVIDTTWQPYYDHLNALGAAGIHADLVTTMNESPSLLLAYPSRVSSSLEAYEGPNEYDLSNDPIWASNLTTFQQMLNSTVRGNAATSQYSVIGPSLTSEHAWLAIGNLSGSEDYGNIHAYFAGRNPAYNMAVARQGAVAEPLIVTESGYDGNSADQNYVPDAVDVRYTMRTLLECWNNGIVRTYIYQFVDDASDGEQYGLLDSSANPKTTYYGVKNLIGALTDPGASFATTPLPYSVTGVSTIQQALFQKRNGSYVLALWNEVPSWNPTTNTVLNVASVSATLSFSKNPSSVSAATFADSGTLSASTISAASGSAYTLSVSDHVTLVTIKP
jgi:hypothetical protein